MHAIGEQELKTAGLGVLQQIVDRTNVLIETDLGFGSAHRGAGAALARNQAEILDQVQRRACGVAADAKTLAQRGFAGQLLADRIIAAADFLTQGFGNLQIARLARRTQSVAVTVTGADIRSSVCLSHNRWEIGE